MRYFFHTAYQGGQYRGWQKHEGILTIQETLEHTFYRILKSPIAITGCGRTDTGVHASQFFFHIDLSIDWTDELLFRLNKTLPTDIAIFGYYPVSEKAHARFDAYSRTYNYFIHLNKDPFMKGLSACYELADLNFEEMKKCMAILIKYQDFAAYCKSPNKYEHTLCFIKESKLYINSTRNRIRFEISSNRFLSGMIRILVSKIIDVGRGRWTLTQFEDHLISKITPPIIKPAHPEGLYLSKISYPYMNIPTQSSIYEMLLVGLEVEL